MKWLPYCSTEETGNSFNLSLNGGLYEFGSLEALLGNRRDGGCKGHGISVWKQDRVSL